MTLTVTLDNRLALDDLAVIQSEELTVGRGQHAYSYIEFKARYSNPLPDSSADTPRV